MTGARAPLLAVTTGGPAAYPGPECGFSPDTAYPEYTWGQVASRPNPVYRAVRELLRQAKLDAERFGTAAWNPLGQYIAPGDRVFVLCNFVTHRGCREGRRAFQAKCIHGSVLRAVLDYVLRAVGPGGSVAFGNAPLQSCMWDRVQAQTGAGAVEAFYRNTPRPILAQDLRLGTAPGAEGVGAGEAVAIDLGSASLLDQVPRPERVRVTDYDPARTVACHAPGRHVYHVHRAVLEADVVVSLPKLKTHEKVGMTGALKGLVGAVARKDCLAHHRMGSRRRGGDEYASNIRALDWLSDLHEWLQRGCGGAVTRRAGRLVECLVRPLLRRCGVPLAGGWSGNDTAWRMVLDLWRILERADASGTVHAKPVRRHLALVDGLIGGEGEGPLHPAPVESRSLVFADDLLLCDIACAHLMGFTPMALPYLRASGAVAERLSGSALVDGQAVPIGQIPCALGRPFCPPPGWRASLGA